jgi:hypothetical protein
MVRFLLMVALTLGCTILGTAQSSPTKVSWKTLQNIKFVKKFYKEIDGEMQAPVFTEELKKLDGKLVQVEGYVVPVDDKGKYVALSAYPYAACFFCGKAGPASVMTVKFKKKNKSYRTDDYVQFRGYLRLNYDDINEFYYILNESEEIK